MGIRIDLNTARDRLLSALESAESDSSVPDEWIQRTNAIAALHSKTYTAALGTALLARATDDKVDVLYLKEQAGNRAYSARTVGHGVLVPVARERGIDLRATGREPLNNQPFFRYERVDRMEKVRYPDQHKTFVETLERVNDLRSAEALLALAAFLRARLQAGKGVVRIDLRETSSDLIGLIAACQTLLQESAEGGKRAQALVAAAFDLAFDDVRTRRVNDPSRAAPGDVQVYQKLAPVLAAEVRSKPVSVADLHDFRDKVVESSFPHGVMAALARKQATLEKATLTAETWNATGLLLTIYDDYAELLTDALAWSGRPLHRTLQGFPRLVARRLEGQEVHGDTLLRWQELVLRHA